METRGTYPTSDAERETRLQSQGSAYVGARIIAVEPDSPAYDAGFEPGCLVTSVDGQPLRDVIDWRWLSGEEAIKVGYVDLDGDDGEVELWREPGEEWGFEFEGLVFDGVKQCRNACAFCFMRMLPHGMRKSLYLRDDDFRLSFLVGTFVTFTNLNADDEARIVEQHISPLRVSLQASNPDVRARLIGRHANHGLEALDRLLAEGIEFHAQIVLVPEQNDGDILVETLEWAWQRPGILDVGIVPLGYTRFQSEFDHSFNDQAAARGLLELISPFQQRALRERGQAWVFAADEFYRNAFRENLLEHVPPLNYYGDFSMFEDGIGIIRSTIDDWERVRTGGSIARTAKALRDAGLVAVMVVGCAQREFLSPLVESAQIADVFVPLYVENAFFGGNVDVTGLLVGEDIAPAVRKWGECESDRNDSSDDCSFEAPRPGDTQAPGRKPLFLVPRVIFNDNDLTLDGMVLEDIEKAAGQPLHVVSCTPLEYFDEIAALVVVQHD